MLQRFDVHENNIEITYFFINLFSQDVLKGVDHFFKNVNF